ncbi:MAG TPA: type 4a pilus biogenesis protein PilO [Burkholderiales bacterium]|nr:type 4a pilus biogenesis protein PilO [Burkholderiales bacterium]
MNFDSLKRLDIKDAGNWPMPWKLAALSLLLVAIVFLGYWFDWKGQFEQLETARQKQEQLKTTFLDKKRQAVNLEMYRKQLADIEQAFGALLKQLPNKSEMDALLTDINQAGLGRGLEFELFKPAPQETVSEFYAELPITIKVSGNYHDMGAFASDVSQLSRIVTLNDINVVTVKNGGLTMEAVAKTFRYLDEEEVAKQRKAAKEKAEKAKGKK